MTEYERSRTMPARPERVFDQVSDIGRLDTWLPRDLHVEIEEPPCVTVHEDRGETDTSASLSARPDRMRLEWGTGVRGGYAGWLQVAGRGGGASEVTVHLSFPDDSHDPGPDTVADALDTSLRRLEDQVRPTTGAARGGAVRGRPPTGAGPVG